MPRIRDHLGHENIERTMKYAEYHPEYGDVRPYFEKMGHRLGFSSSVPVKNGNGKHPESVLRTILGEVEALQESTDGKRAQLNHIVAKIAEVVGAEGDIPGDSSGDTPSDGNGSKTRNPLNSQELQK